MLCPFKMASFIQSHIDFNWMSSLEWVRSTSAVLISFKDVYKSYELESGHTMQSDDGIWMQACFPLRCSQQGNRSARDEEQSFYSARLDSILVSCMKDFWIGKQAMKTSKPRCFIAFFIIEIRIANIWAHILHVPYGRVNITKLEYYIDSCQHDLFSG